MKPPRWRWRVSESPIGVVARVGGSVRGPGVTGPRKVAGAASPAGTGGGSAAWVAGATQRRWTQIRSPLQSVSLVQPSSPRAAAAETKTMTRSAILSFTGFPSRRATAVAVASSEIVRRRQKCCRDFLPQPFRNLRQHPATGFTLDPRRVAHAFAEVQEDPGRGGIFQHDLDAPPRPVPAVPVAQLVESDRRLSDEVGTCCLGLDRKTKIHERAPDGVEDDSRSEEHTSELQSQSNLACRLLLENTK